MEILLIIDEAVEKKMMQWLGIKSAMENLAVKHDIGDMLFGAVCLALKEKQSIITLTEDRIKKIME